METLHTDEMALAHFNPLDAEGDAVPAAGVVTWTSDDPTKIELDPTADGLACTVKALAVTTVPVAVHATDGVAATSDTVEVLTPAEAKATITWDPATPKS